MADPTYLTELEAINMMQTAIGNPPFAALGGTNRDEVLAEAILDEASRDVQLEGWVFNTELKVTVTSDGSGFITLPTNTIQIDAWHPGNDWTFRNGKLYDRFNHTDVFALSTDFLVNFTYLFEWVKLPEVARNYTAKTAIHMFVERVGGSEKRSLWARREELFGRTRMLREEGLNRDRTMLDKLPQARLGRRGIGFVA